MDTRLFTTTQLNSLVNKILKTTIEFCDENNLKIEELDGDHWQQIKYQIKDCYSRCSYLIGNNNRSKTKG